MASKDQGTLDLHVNLKGLVQTAVSNFRAIAEAVPDGDKALPKQLARQARKTKQLAILVLEEINETIQRQKAAATKEKQ